MNPIQLSCLARRAYSKSTKYREATKEGLCFSCEAKETFGPGKEFRICIKNERQENFLGVIHIRVLAKQKNPKIFMPGYIYGHNTGEKPNHGRKEFPRIREGECQRPESEFWMTRSDRLAEPLSLVYDEGHVFGIAAPPYFCWEEGQKFPAIAGEGTPGAFYQYGGFTCRVHEKTEEGIYAGVGYTLGYEHAPWLFIQSATVMERAELTESNSFELAAGVSVCFPVRIYDYEAESELGIHEAVKDAYFYYHQLPRKIEGMDIAGATALLSHAVRDHAWLKEENMYSGFVYDTKGGYTYNKIGSLTWTNGLAVAAPMLMAANRQQDPVMREQALAFIKEVTTKSLNPRSGLPYDAVSDGVWSVKGWWYDGMHSGGHSAYLTGQAVYYLLKAYLSEQQAGREEHPDWIAFAGAVIRKVNETTNTDGEYPFALSEETGAGLEYDSMGSAWCLTATALYSLITGGREYLPGMKKSEQHYYDKFVKRVECYGGPLDTDKAVDSEGILAYIRAARLLHELTGEEKYLEHLRDGIYYEVTFKLGYNTPVKIRPLSEVGWSSCGGSITSTANPHIHPMSSTVVDEMLYLTEHRRDDYIKNRLKDTILWGLQTFNTRDKEYGYGRPGWMSERFCFCEGLLTEKYPDQSPASTWFALMPWAVASLLEGFTGELWQE